MKSLRVLLMLGVALGLARLSLLADASEPSGLRMARAADAFLQSLSPEQRKQAVFAFDGPERLAWNFVPLQDKKRKPTRKGARIEEMTAEQRQAALDLLRTGTSEKGFQQATTIMSLEGVLADLEKNGAMVRNPGWYFVSIYGTPGKTGSWGWRFEGHHLSINFTLQDGQVVSTTPFMFGANPAEVKTGPKKGLRTLPEVEDLARDLFKSLDDDQRKLALQDRQFPEIDQIPAAKPIPTVGIAASKLNDAQKATLVKLIKAYAHRLPKDLAELELNRALKDIDAIHFGYAGATEPGKPYTYQLQGPGFQVQFLNVQPDGSQNPANHIHSAWRTLPKDFGVR